MNRKVTALAGRLRVLHAELTDQPADMRAEQLRDEVQRVVSALQPPAREPFLTELTRQFPLWSADGVGAAPVIPASGGAKAPVAAAAAPEPKDPKSIAERLIEACKGMSDADKQIIAARLSAGGLVLRASGGAAAAPAGAGATGSVGAGGAGELRKVLGMPADAPIDANRAVEMAAVLSDFVLKLEPWACTLWRDIAPDGKNQVFQTLNKDLAKYMQGDDKASKELLARNAHNLRSLISLLLKGVVDAGKQFARDHLSRFGVEQIGQAAGSGSLMTSKDVLCWKQYVRQMEGVDAAAIEKRLKSLIAKDVDAGLGQMIK